ncbi:MAG: hypothetical protein C0522_10975 [Rhodocyclaceae bacterium]|jgi:hypothetical protein|nr:hypothetical protein [Rhodocyclaceae bacterium]
MKLKKLTWIAALAMFSLSGAANAMLPMMFLMMGPAMGMGGMMHGMGGHGGSAQGASPAEGHDHAGGKEAGGAAGDAAGGEHRHESAAGTPGSVGAAGTDRPSAEGAGSGRMKADDGSHERH